MVNTEIQRKQSTLPYSVAAVASRLEVICCWSPIYIWTQRRSEQSCNCVIHHQSTWSSWFHYLTRIFQVRFAHLPVNQLAPPAARGWKKKRGRDGRSPVCGGWLESTMSSVTGGKVPPVKWAEVKGAIYSAAPASLRSFDETREGVRKGKKSLSEHLPLHILWNPSSEVRGQHPGCTGPRLLPKLVSSVLLKTGLLSLRLRMSGQSCLTATTEGA